MKATRIVLASVAFFAVVTAQQQARAAATLDPSRGAVLPANAALAVLQQCSRDAPGHRPDHSQPVSAASLPTRAEIQELEARLGPLLIEGLGADPYSRNLVASDYFRQYAALTIAGRRIIYVNGFHRLDFPQRGDWRRDPVLVCDGGRYFFGVEYDPETR